MDAKRPAGVCHCSIEKLCQSRTVKHSNGVLFETTSSLVTDTSEKLQALSLFIQSGWRGEFSVAIKEFSSKSCVKHAHGAWQRRLGANWACSNWSLKVAV